MYFATYYLKYMNKKGFMQYFQNTVAILKNSPDTQDDIIPNYILC